MPRAGKGQKVQTASGQQYGQAKAQEESQALVPLPQMQVPAPETRPGGRALARPSERPNESVMAQAAMPTQTPQISVDQRMKAMTVLPMMEQMASRPGASPHMRNTVRRLKSFVGNMDDFADRGFDPAAVKDA